MNISNTDFACSNASSTFNANNVSFGAKIIRFKNGSTTKDLFLKAEKKVQSNSEVMPKKTSGIKDKLTTAAELLLGTGVVAYDYIKGASNLKKTAGLAALAGLIYSAVNIASAPSNVVKIPMNENIDTEHLSNLYGVSSSAITAYNELPEVSADKNTILIPSKFYYIKEKELELIEKSKSENLSSQDKIKTSKQISALKRKKEAQDKIADVFADDNYVYKILIANMLLLRQYLLMISKHYSILKKEL